MALNIRDKWRTLRELTIAVNKIADESQLRIALDITESRLRWGASADDYLFFRFWELDRKKRRTYFTGHDSVKIMRKFNNPKYLHMFRNKAIFAEKFSEFLGREWLSLNGITKEQLAKFVSHKEHIIYKPLTGNQGKGIKKINLAEFKDIDCLYDYFRNAHLVDGILENWIVQHEEISQFYDKAVHPIRVMTIRKNDVCNVLKAFITIGDSGDIANMMMGGIIASIEVESGIILLPGQDLRGITYLKHPITDAPIVGFRVPFWDELIKMIDRASSIVPEVAYVGWDVAITSDGPVIIEGNDRPEHRHQQMSAHLQDRIGLRKTYEQFL